MARRNLLALQNQMAGIIDSSASAPSGGGPEWNLRLSLLNRAQEVWAEAYNWPSLYAETHLLASTPTGMASLPLPSDFRKLASYPKVADANNTNSYAEIRPEEKEQYAVSDKYVYVLGDIGSYNLIFNPGSITSGMSIFYPYYRSPASLASPASFSIVPNPDFLVDKALSYYFAGKDDDIRMEREAMSNRTLGEMINYEVNKGDATDKRKKSWLESKWGFRFGRDQ